MSTKRPPNLLFLYTDEQTWRTLAAYGNDRIQMPALNAFSRTCTVIDEAYCTQPVCTPSRSSILTGYYPHTTGCMGNNVALRPDCPTLIERLPSGVYRTGHFGKWHLGDEIFQQRGFDDWRSTEDGYEEFYGAGRDDAARSTYHHWLVERGVTPKNGTMFTRAETARLSEPNSKPAYLADEAIQFLQAQRSKPFALYVNFLEPHMPFFGPRDDQYDLDAIPLPQTINNWPSDDQPLKARVYAEAYYQNGMSGLALKTKADWRRMIANYWGLCSLVDTHVGRILGALSELGLDDQTIVVFTSDHGDMMGSHRLLAKGVMFQESIRVPLLIRQPGQRQSQRITGPVSLVDLVPTLLELMDLPVPDDLHGTSLKPALMQADDVQLKRDVVVEWHGPNTGIVGEGGPYHVPESLQGRVTPEDIARHVADPVRTIITADGWKLNLSTLGEDELYDLGSDPGEIHNRVHDSDQADRVKALTDRMRTWQRQVGDGLS
ncbi:MAG: sulfatase-like hydrolase/transferase [Verrucomicrobia bacterium]|nr:sulfatase-like hydrolase/transferase [Verrucomicrobiota bacterium]